MSEWEQMTPRELIWLLSAWREKQKDSAKVEKAKIYVLGGTVRTMMYAKRPPRFEKLFPDEERKQRKMSDDQLYKQVLAWNRLFGGKEA